MAMTCLQIFGIGFSFGIIGPCFLICTPILVTYIIGSKKLFGDVLGDTITFLIGRALAYIMLGAVAGVSGFYLNQFVNSRVAAFFKPAAGIISIMLAAFILINKGDMPWVCSSSRGRKYNYTSLVMLGFVIGIMPCAPLLALLFEITLMSKSAAEGALYALSFGLGTFLSGLLVISSLTGILVLFPAKFLKSKTSNLLFRMLCAMFLILLGISLIVESFYG